jgi:exonuclease III
MEIVSWNCNGALRKKLGAISAFNADVFIIQECEDPACSSDAAYRTWAGNHLWVGTNKNRGIGVFAKSTVSLRRVDLDVGSLELFLPCIVADKISLLATWTREAKSPTFRYIGQLWKFLQRHPKFLSNEKSMLIGDLNSSVRWDVWDRWWNHSDVVRELKSAGLESLYHLVRGDSQGSETIPTFYMHRKREKPYHIDYAFISCDFLDGASIEVGNPEQWLEHSDHMPLRVKLAMDA